MRERRQRCLPNSLYISALALVFVCFVASCSSCSQEHASSGSDPADTVAVLVNRISRQSRLYTAEYRIHKIITHTDDKRMEVTALGTKYSFKAPFSERAIAIPIDVTLKAYVDMGEFTDLHVMRTDSSLHIILPDPHIVLTASKVDQHAIRQYNDIGRASFSDKEISRFQQLGTDSIVFHIGRYRLAEEARQSAVRVIAPLLTQLGYNARNVTISFRKNFSDEELRQFIETPEITKD